MYDSLLEKVETLDKRLTLSSKNSLEKKSDYLSSLSNHLAAVSPFNVIKRGYSLVENEEGKIIKSAKEAKAGDKLKTIMKDGIIVSIVEERIDE